MIHIKYSLICFLIVWVLEATIDHIFKYEKIYAETHRPNST
jgi:hypothetical protein